MISEGTIVECKGARRGLKSLRNLKRLATPKRAAPLLLLHVADEISERGAFLVCPLPPFIRSQNYKWFEYKPDKSTELKNPKFRKIHIWDGGVYDNLGMEALVKYDKGCVYRKEFDFLIISDASKAIEPAPYSLIMPAKHAKNTNKKNRSAILLYYHKSIYRWMPETFQLHQEIYGRAPGRKALLSRNTRGR